MNIKSSKELVDEANKVIKVLKPSEVKDALGNKDVVLVDIRDIRELWRDGTIEGSTHIPRGMLEFWLDPESQYYREKKINKEKKIILFCALGFRSALATKSLTDMGFTEVYNAEGGFNALKETGLKVVEKDKK
tara:strand:+ start:1174 stop:1572 length:399 start_codon:yes stop_codon:yes gene_type:complete